ncbi:chain B reaction center subunit PshX [Heliorestis convoluta]|uniref:Chain B reaction center subunit PshX n=1 Tax=Heliorestis convoluta TaxID=356322 RepID=A0A6B9IBH0_9FIRM|nr:chain B reaction center subunit PshX [Heliorestis convoluta]
MEMYSPIWNVAHVLALMLLLLHIPYYFVLKD